MGCGDNASIGEQNEPRRPKIPRSSNQIDQARVYCGQTPFATKHSGSNSDDQRRKKQNIKNPTPFAGLGAESGPLPE